MSGPRLLDLYCGAGGAAMGYHRAGFDVVGVDIAPQPRYPFEFHQGDALEFLAEHEREFDAVHASPPCQYWSDLAKRNGNADDHPQLIEPTRNALLGLDLPWVIENVEGAPLRDPVVLCGTQFPGLRVIRHRLFETSDDVVIPALPHGPHPLVYTLDKRKAHYGRLDQDTAFVMVNGGGNCSVVNKRAAMGIDWMTGAELNEAIPPAYGEHVGRALRAAVNERNGDDEGRDRQREDPPRGVADASEAEADRPLGLGARAERRARGGRPSLTPEPDRAVGVDA